MVLSPFRINPLEDRSRCILRLLTASILGALAGALCAKIAVTNSLSLLFVPSDVCRRSGFIRVLAMTLVFPGFLFAAFVSGHRWLFYPAFLLRSAMICYLLCFCSGCGIQLVQAERIVFIRSVLPLPLHFLTAACLMSAPSHYAKRVWPAFFLWNLIVSALTSAAELLFD